MKFYLFFLSTFLLLNLFSLQSEELVITPKDGETFSLKIDSSEPFDEVIDQIQDCLNQQDIEEATVLISDEASSNSFSMLIPRNYETKEKNHKARDYSSPVTKEEKENISLIICSLANYNKKDLLTNRSHLKSVGDKIRHIHPFRFLECVFTDEELKVNLSVIRHKEMVWDKYYKGLKKSLMEESQRKNLEPFIHDFAARIGVNALDILPFIRGNQWNEFIDFLINGIQRTGDPDRYDG